MLLVVGVFWNALILSPLFLTSVHLVESTQLYPLLKQFNANTSLVKADTNATSTGNNTAPIEDSIMKLRFTLKEASVVPFLRDETFYRHDIYNITTSDLIQLFSLDEMDLNQTFNILQKLNISENILNVDNFEALLKISNMTFNDFFERLKNTTNLNGGPLQEALQILSINPANFSNGVTFGPESIVYDSLKKGVYSIEKFEEAAGKVGTNLTTFYKNAKAIILEHMKMNSIQYYAERLRNTMGFGKTLYDNIWKVYDIKLTDVYRVPNYKQIIDNTFNRLNENVTIGVAIGDHEIAFHRKIYNKMQMVTEIVNIHAESTSAPVKLYQYLTLMNGSSQATKILWSNSTLNSKIEIVKDLDDKTMENCTYITINNTQLTRNPVQVINKTEGYILVKVENQNNFNYGNPLICSGKLAGLASKYHMENNLIEYETLFKKSGSNSNSGYTDKRMFAVYLNLLSIIFLSLIC